MTSPIVIEAIDHLVLTVADVEEACECYGRVLGMETVTFAGGRKALAFGRQKLNLHQAGAEYVPHAGNPVPGSADLCLITMTPLETVMAHLEASAVAVEEGPVAKTGATGSITSVYFRDPDGNLIEISNYD